MQKREVAEERIIEAAVSMFSRRGYNGTSTREIARMAGVNQGILFRYFPRKESLFWTALETRLAGMDVHEELQPALAQHAAPAVAIPLIIETILQVVAKDPALVRLLLVGLVELGPESRKVLSQHLSPLAGAVCDYLATGVRSGCLRDVDPTVAASAFVSTVLLQHGVHCLLREDAAPDQDLDQAVTAHSNFWLAALTAPEGERKKAAAAPAAGLAISRTLH